MMALFAAVYVMQGIAFGFQSTAYPLLARQAGASLTSIGAFQVLQLPWLFKPLVAPYLSSDHRTLLLLCCAVTAAALLASFAGPASLLLLNALVAMLDVVVDGLMLRLLSASQLGTGNTIQLVGFKLGMVLGGPGILTLTTDAREAALCMTCCLASLTVGIWVQAPSTALEGSTDSERKLECGKRGMQWLNGVSWTPLVLILTYKVGESVGDRMFKLYLLDSNSSTLRTVATVQSAAGLFSSIGGSIVGGWITTWWSTRNAVQIATALSAGAQLVRYTVVANGVPLATAAALVEGMTGGILSTCLCAYMMTLAQTSSDPTTVFAQLSSFELVGKLVPSLASGLLVDLLGYPIVFGMAAALSCATAFIARLI